MKKLDSPKIFQLPILGTQFVNPGYVPRVVVVMEVLLPEVLAAVVEVGVAVDGKY